MAFTWVNLRGMKLDPVFTSSSAKAGNEKFAGKDENCVGMELFQLPVAGTSGLSWLIPKLGTRGSKKTRRRPVLHDSSQPKILRGTGCNSRDTQPKDEEDGEPPGKPASTQPSVSSPPVLPLFVPGFCLSFLLTTPTHFMQFRSLPLRAKGRDCNHLHMRPCGTDGIILNELSARNWLVPVPRVD